MELKLAETIREAIAECGEDAELYEEYRGRGMSKPTTGVICDNFTTIIKCIIDCADLFCDEDGQAEFNVTNLSADSLGKRVIVY